MSTLLLLASLAAVDAPITQVTVFSDQARTVRTATIAVNGVQQFELPALPDTIDVSSIKVEATGAEVRRVDIERLAPERLRTTEAVALLGELDALDAELSRLSQEKLALGSQRDALSRVVPTTPQPEPLKPPARLNGAGWITSATFIAEQLAKVHARLRDAEQHLATLSETRDLLAGKARLMGELPQRSGWLVIAELSGNGAATLTLTYLVRSAQWTPTWDLQLQPETNAVNLSLAGIVAQATGEDWDNARLTLSTAIPSSAIATPKLTTWKIGVADRFIPTPTPMYEYVAPPPPTPPLLTPRQEEELVRARLANLERPEGKERRNAEYDRRDFGANYRAAAPPPPVAARQLLPEAPVEPRGVEELAGDSAAVVVTARAFEGGSSSARWKHPSEQLATFSLSPPAAWSPPAFGPDSPVTLAAGYDLTFGALQKETVLSAKGARRIALWAAQWPVSVERKLYPALTQDAFLVAELKNPSSQVLPGGPAQLYVGADPAGSARLKLVSPGEAFTLPLGIDRALKPVRNVRLVEAVQGVISKDEVGTYTVTIELANPYNTAVAVRIFDQWPVTTQKDLATKLVDSKPTAIQEAAKGSLEWRLTVAAQQKTQVSFTYMVKRPRGWKLGQTEVTP